MTDIECMDCDEVFDHLDDYIDRELSKEDIARLEAHLHQCAHCAEAAQFEKSVIECIRKKVDRINAPKELLDRVRAALDEG